MGETSTMFCFQCEQTAGCSGCTGAAGVCGKTAGTAHLQDDLTGALVGLARTVCAAQDASGSDVEALRRSADDVAMEGLFATLTNVDFDDAELERLITRAHELGARIAALAGIDVAPDYALDELWKAPEDVRSLKSLVLFGLRGMAAYAYHAAALGYRDGMVTDFLHEGLDSLATAAADKLLPLALMVGEVNLRCMELLDRANTETFGTPEPTQVTRTVEAGPFIVATGHDLHDLKLLLDQAVGRGVNVYTHGELLPAHAYPLFKQYPHLKGNLGTAWQNQRSEFANLPAPVLFTTNCLMPPATSYADRVFTTGPVADPGAVHIEELGEGACANRDGNAGGGLAGEGIPAADSALAAAAPIAGVVGDAAADASVLASQAPATGASKDFSPLIERALELGGYDEPHTFPGMNDGEGPLTTGFGHGTILGVADTVIDAVKQGAISRFFLVGGCDGARSSRSYFTDFVQQAPEDSIILTLACGKFRFNDLDLGMIGSLPRLMDMGQCNDAYGAVRVALALADAFECTVNDLPLTLVLSWYEQKAVCILLTLLHLGIKGIYFGPTLPAFVSPGVLDVLVREFDVRPITTPEKDLAVILG